MNINDLVRKEIYSLTPYVPGKPAEEVRRELGLQRVIKLASNENPLGPSPKAVKRIAEIAPYCHVYPDASGFALKSAISRKYGIESSQIILGNGSDEIIMLLGQIFIEPGDEAVMPTPSFPMYRTAVLLMGGLPVEVPVRNGFLDVEEMVKKITPRTKLLFLCNPNNPTGAMVTRQEVEYLMARVPDSVVVVSDEAYAEYIEDPDYGDMLPYVKEGRNVVVLHTFSKIYGLAGLRVGYGLVPKWLPPIYDRVRSAFNQNAIGQAAAVEALDDEDHVRQSIQNNREGMAFLTGELGSMGLRVYQSWANFVLVDTFCDGQKVFSELLKRGIIVRPTTAWGLNTCLRITIGTQEENNMLIEALKEIMPLLK